MTTSAAVRSYTTPGGTTERGVRLGMVFLDGTNMRAHQKAAGAAKRADLQPGEMLVRLLADRVAGMGPRPA